MEMRWAPEQRPRVPRRPADQPSFSSTLLDAICDSMDGGPEARRAAPTRLAASAYPASRTTPSGAAKKQQEREAALHCYYYKPALASSYRLREPHTPSAAAGDCSGRGYFSSSEAEHSLRRLRPIRTSVSLAPTHAAPEKMARTTKKPTAATRGCNRPASPGARLASLLNSIFSGKRHSSVRRTTPADQDPTCSTAPSSYARSCLSKKTPPPASRSRSTRTVKFLDIDGEVAVAAAAVGRCRRIPVVEVVEEELLRPVDVEVDYMGGGEKSSGASSDLFELENLGAVAPESGFLSDRDGSYGNELPVYGSTGVVGLRRHIAHPRLYDYRPYGALSRSCRKADFN
uniref:Uncharacterized protein n=1 Tax=Avena sativa TaxID=4498 RepID=A0ACD5TXR6_AVESA